MIDDLPDLPVPFKIFIRNKSAKNKFVGLTGS